MIWYCMAWSGRIMRGMIAYVLAFCIGLIVMSMIHRTVLCYDVLCGVVRLLYIST